MDGSKAGLLRQKEVKTGARYEDRPVGPEGKAPNQSLDRHISPAYRADLPTDPEAMRDWLYQDTDHGAAGTDATAWTKIGDPLREQYVTPASQAAMFEAAATIPGTTLVRQADLASRAGGRPAAGPERRRRGMDRPGAGRHRRPRRSAALRRVPQEGMPPRGEQVRR